MGHIGASNVPATPGGSSVNVPAACAGVTSVSVTTPRPLPSVMPFVQSAFTLPRSILERGEAAVLVGRLRVAPRGGELVAGHGDLELEVVLTGLHDSRVERRAVRALLDLVGKGEDEGGGQEHATVRDVERLVADPSAGSVDGEPESAVHDGGTGRRRRGHGGARGVRRIVVPDAAVESIGHAVVTAFRADRNGPSVRGTVGRRGIRDRAAARSGCPGGDDRQRERKEAAHPARPLSGRRCPSCRPSRSPP